MRYNCTLSYKCCIIRNKAGYTATSVTYGWAGAVIEVTPSFGQEY